MRVIRLTRTPRGWRADEFAEPPLAGLNARVGARPLAAAMGDDAVLFRILSLPRADGDAMAGMVRGQLEVLVPAQADRFTHAWRARPDPDRPDRQRVLLCAARHDTVDPIAEACGQLGSQPRAVVPSILAVAALWAQTGGADGAPTVLIDVAPRCTALAVVAGPEVLGAAVIDEGADRWAERGDGDLGPWARELKEAFDHCLTDIPADRRPISCVLFGPHASADGLVERAGEALALPASIATPAEAVDLAEGIDYPAAAVAIGAAMAAMEPDGPAVSLYTPQAAAPARRRLKVSRRCVALAAWLVAAVAAMYGLDRLDAWRSGRALADARRRTDKVAPLQRQMQIGRYMESGGPGPLDVLDRISAAVPKSMLLTAWRYDRGEAAADVTLGGTVPDEKEFLKVLERLSDVGEVRWRTGKPEEKRFRFEVQLRVDRHRKPAKTKPRAPAGREAPDKPASSAPAGAGGAAPPPASAPAVGGRR